MRLNLVDGRLQEKIAEEVIAELKRDRSVADVYSFESMAELHEFLWHGHDRNWEF